MAEPSKVYFFMAGKDGRESEPAAITLEPDGSADLSLLPDPVRGHLTRFGVRNLTHTGQVMPDDGELFLECLLEASNGPWRFRTSPEKSS